MNAPLSYDRPVPLWALPLTRILFIVCLGVITYFSLMPSGSAVTIAHYDKVQHIIGYGGLTGLLALAMPRLSLRWVFIWPGLYGGLIELAQSSMAYGRTGSVWDLFANMTGAGLAILGWWICARLLQRFR